MSIPSLPSPRAENPAWRMTWLIKSSMALHAAALVWVLLAPGQWPWALAVVAVNHLAITVAGLLPRSTALGPNVTRLPPVNAARGEIALTIDDGPDPNVTPRVLELLHYGGARATFFCIGERVAKYPELARRILLEGHTIQNHTEHHSHAFSLMGPRKCKREILAAQRTMLRTLGILPRCFRAPAGLRNPFLAPVLHKLDLTLVSWTRRGYDTRERSPERVLRRLTRGLRAGDILLLHDGHAARAADGAPVILHVLPPLLEHIRGAGLRTVTLPHATVNPS